MKTSVIVSVLVLAGLAGACHSGGEEESDSASTSQIVDPFAETPDRTEGIVNVSRDINEILEHGTLENACRELEARPDDRRALLRCGKWMFFYETFGTAGVPAAIPKFLIEEFPEEIGPGMTKLGLIEDPYSPDRLPLGLAPTTNGRVESLALTCPSCHVAKLPDGRFAVGATNHAYEYGKHNLAMTVFPMVALMGGADRHDPAAVAKVQPLLDRVDQEVHRAAPPATDLASARA